MTAGPADRDDEDVRLARVPRRGRRVREWQIVTVAFAWSSSSATGLPTMSLRPTTTARAPSSGTSYSSSSAMTPSGVARHERRAAEESWPAFSGWKPSTSLTGSIARMTRASSMCSGQRQLDEDAVDRVVGVQLGDELEQLVLGVVAGEPRCRARRCRPRPRPCACAGCRCPRPGRRRRAPSRARARRARAPPPRPRARMRSASALPSISVAANLELRQLDVADVEAERLGELDARPRGPRWSRCDVARRASRRPITARAFGRQSACWTKIGSSRFAASTSFWFVFLPGVLQQDALVRHAGAVVDAVVGREPVAEVLEHRARATRARSGGSAR